MRVLIVGDVYGKPGLHAVSTALPGLLRSEKIDFCIVNGENAEHGKGITPQGFNKLVDAGADVVTGGNHILYRDKIQDFISQEKRLLRPENFPEGTPGKGVEIYSATNGRQVAVVNLMGRALMAPSDDPFRMGRDLAAKLRDETNLIFIDFHAEASAEKIAFAKFMDGKVTAIIGTHTHVQTADESVSEDGTAYITDVGMTGSHAGVIGMDYDSAIYRFLYPMGGGKSGEAEGDVRLSAVIIDCDAESGRAKNIRRMQLKDL